MARPSSASNASRLATSTTLIPDAAICRVNSLPIPDEAPVTSAQGPNRPLSSTAFIVLFLSVDCTCCSIVRSHSVPNRLVMRIVATRSRRTTHCLLLQPPRIARKVDLEIIERQGLAVLMLTVEIFVDDPAAPPRSSN